MLTYDDLIIRLTDWASAEPDVRAALILGSRARRDHPADEWSDLDVLVFAGNCDRFIRDTAWASSLAPCWLTFAERTPEGRSWEQRTLYADGLDVDVSFEPVEALEGILKEIPADVADIIRRGVKVLVDKDGKLAQIINMPLPEAGFFQKPSEQEFVNATSDFWYHTLWSAKHLRRGELWWAISCVDMHLKGLLCNMLEWHARAKRGGSFDTWMRGRFLEEWAEPRAVEQLRDTFAYYALPDIARALHATMDLYRWLEDETAARWGYTCPLEGEHQAAGQALQLLQPIKGT